MNIEDSISKSYEMCLQLSAKCYGHISSHCRCSQRCVLVFGSCSHEEYFKHHPFHIVKSFDIFNQQSVHNITLVLSPNQCLNQDLRLRRCRKTYKSYDLQSTLVPLFKKCGRVKLYLYLCVL